MHKMRDKITEVTTRITNAALSANRNPAEITLLAVSKRQSDQKIAAAYAVGLRDFGENYLQEASAKIERLQLADARWHFIGPIQSNKTRAIAEQFDWVHSVDRLKIAQRLNQQRGPRAPLNLCLQINIDDETNKAGATPDEAEALALKIAALPNICLRGLMVIPLNPNTTANEDCPFLRTRLLFERLKTLPQLANMDTLSMGMSADIETAIAQGATIVRVGTALFGDRD